MKRIQKKQVLHGMCYTKEYRAWKNMRDRCNNPNNSSYRNYGARGITICKEWDEFTSFFKDVGKKSSPELTLERRDNDKGYGPDNCYWASRMVQSRNQRPRAQNKTGFIGVNWDKAANKYRAAIGVNEKRITIGRFSEIEDAITARIDAEKQYWGTSRMAEPLAQQTLSTTMQRK